MNSREMAYIDETTAYLVAGRALDATFSQEAFDQFCSAVDVLAEELGQPLVALPAGISATRSSRSRTRII